MLIRIPLIAVFLSLVFNVAAKAQQDTTLYELGRLNLSKKFTQSVTIKAAELEKIPFTNINDVITTWLYGYYGDKRSYVYVVDGFLNTDVNAYSIFDIDEITMVQNAAAYLNGALPGQVLLLVKTKRGTKPGSGVNVNGQTNLVNVRSAYDNAGSSKEFYSQYYLSAYKNTGKVNAGFSASVQSNPYPTSNFTTIPSDTYTANRFKFSGYLNAQLNKANSLNITTGYVPQNDDVSIIQRGLTAQGYNTFNSTGSGTQKLFYANAGLISNIAGKLVNRLNLGYQTQNTNGNLSRSQESVQMYGSSAVILNYNTKIDSAENLKSFVFNDNLSYNINVGKLSIQPAVNFTYKKLTSNSSYLSNSTVVQTNQVQNFYRNTAGKTSVSLLTPSIAFNYQDMILLQGGFQQFLSTGLQNSYAVEKPAITPFANVGVDVLKAINVKSASSSLVFSASYAKAMVTGAEPRATLSDQVIPFTSTTTYPYAPGSNFLARFDQFQGGVSYAILSNRLSFSYNYQQIKQSNPVIVSQYAYFPIPAYLLFNKQGKIHRVAVNADILTHGNLKWSSLFNITAFKYVLYDAQNKPFYDQTTQPNTNYVTGGMVNRLAYKKFSGGLDILYCFNQGGFIGSQYTGLGSKYYSINLQNIYAGYSFKVSGQRNFEVYANSRNMLMTNSSTITDNRRFYGVGFKAAL
ncbi:hypothetical protein ACFQZS_13935 [Mucilaginibacter calamicampi]|uniref:Uncharacterized protein n=1 Tax=Mucilaginibacter calamicampi TaxID=1302352 RepID=A0ABW2YXZ4_9SPHI